METCIRLDGLTKDYTTKDETHRAVDGISFDVSPGEIVALLGPNGAGKTTTLDMVLGFTQPTAGSVSVFGQTPRQAIAAGRVTAVLQTGGLLRDLTVAETVDLIASTYADPAPPAEVLARADLTDARNRPVSKCSGGEQQRLRFALALLARPDLLILDEPTAGVDVEGRRAFWDAMQAEVDDGRTVVFATHYLTEAEDFSNRTIVLANGVVVADGPTEDVRHTVVDRLITAQVPPDRIAAAAERIRGLASAHDVAIDGSKLTVKASDSDAVARELLGPLGASDVLIQSASLEEAFLQLTEGNS